MLEEGAFGLIVVMMGLALSLELDSIWVSDLNNKFTLSPVFALSS